MTWNKWNTIQLIIGIFIYLPLWFYLIYWLIKQNNPDRLIWFLFWVYIPIMLLTQLINEIAKSQKE